MWRGVQLGCGKFGFSNWPFNGLMEIMGMTVRRMRAHGNTNTVTQGSVHGMHGAWQGQAQGRRVGMGDARLP